MRIGLCTNMTASAPDGTGAEYADRLARLGFDYIELPLAEVTALSPAAFDGLKDRVAASGIRCECCNNFFPKTARLTGPAVNTPEIMAYAEKALSRAHALGAEVVVFGSGPAKNVPEGFPKEEGLKQVARLLRLIAPVARKYGIWIVIEPLRRQECNIVNTFAAGCALAGEVSEPNVAALVDYYHLRQENEPVKSLVDDGGRYLRHVHFAKEEGRGYPGGQEDYGEFFGALAAAGYSGRISLEAYTRDFGAEAPAALEFLREAVKKK